MKDEDSEASLDDGVSSSSSVQLDLEMNSNSSEFLNYEMPAFEYQTPACFCNKKGLCQKHQVKPLSTTGLLRLLKKQFEGVRKDEKFQNEEILNISKVAKEIIVSR